MATTPDTGKGSSAQPAEGLGGAALLVIAVVVAGAALHWMGGILSPLALAIFLMVMIESFTRTLKARLPMLPEWAALGSALAILVMAFLISAWIVAQYASGFIEQISGYGPRLNVLIARLSQSAGIAAAPTIGQIFQSFDPMKYIGVIAQGFQSFLANISYVLIYLGFLMASRAGFRRKWVTLWPGHEERSHAMAVFGRIKIGVERYLWVQTVTGLMIAVASWAAMAIVGLDNAFFWAFLIFVVGYIPIIGPLVAGLIPPVFALVQFEGFLPAIVLLVSLNAINIVVGNLILPRMQADSLNLDPVVVLLSLAFWGAIWGVSGMFLSTPLTVAVMVVLAQFKASHWIAVLLSGDGDPLGAHRGRLAATAEK
jgi:AI-2 transport protein TqsA